MMSFKKVAVVIFLAALNAAADPSRHFTRHFQGAPDSALAVVPPPAFQGADASRAGARVYSTQCVSCHGRNAMGTGNIPALARGDAQSASEGELFWFIRNGSIPNGMPAFNFPDSQLWQVVAFVKSLKDVPTEKIPALLTDQPSDRSSTQMGPPAAPFTDFRFETPGTKHHIRVSDLPAPTVGNSPRNGPSIVARPKDAWPKVPAGFEVQLFASNLDNPRLLRTAPNGDIFLAESASGKIRVFRGMTKEGKPEQAEVFATNLDRPYGIAFYPPGNSPKWIYVGQTNAIVRFPYASGDLHASGPSQRIAELPYEGGHWTRDLIFSRDGTKLFVAVGSLSNIDDSDTSPRERGRAAIHVLNPDGSGDKIYASGIRNAGGGLAMDPITGELWCSVNERDALGDNLVPDYITRVKEGGFYGWPWWYMGGNQDPRHLGKHPELKSSVITPDVLLQPHHASLELTFYDGSMFPKEYAGDIFSAQHGSWNRSVRTGYEVIRVPLHGKDKPNGDYEDFMTGFVVDNDSVWGRPVGVAVAHDGSLLVSDDGSNSIWRVVSKNK